MKNIGAKLGRIRDLIMIMFENIKRLAKRLWLEIPAK